MILNDGTLDGARILSADTVAMMSKNHIGEVGVPAVKTAQPNVSMDFTFINDGKDKWGLGFLLTSSQVAGKRSPGSLSWGGVNNTYFWIDPARDIAGVDHDAGAPVCRHQGARDLRHLRARRVSTGRRVA